MCGIAGILGLSNSAGINPQTIKKMCDVIAHRGPDGEGFSVSNHFTSLSFKASSLKCERPFQFGHRRLSIIDLSQTANQPMVDSSGRYVLVFNGEIYNHATLRLELEKLGVNFRTSHSDTEVLLNGLIIHGKGFIKKLNGMFAFSFYDIEMDYAIVVRDRLGIKPLFYSIINNSFCFSSEVKSLKQVAGFNKKIDYTSLNDFLVFSSVKAPKTIFEDTFQLAPGCLIEVEDGVVTKQQKYWSLLDVEKSNLSLRDSQEKLLSSFDESARKRMLADVKVGVLLSGGVDSTANLGVLSKYSDKPISAFSIGFENESGFTNEFEYSRIAAKHFNADYHELKLNHEDYVHGLKEIISFQDTPISDTANVPIYLIAKSARENGITVLLGGEGSDELLIGYSYWSMANKYEQQFKGKAWKSRLAKKVHSAPVIRNKRTIYHDWYKKTSLGFTHFGGGTETRTINKAREILSPDVLKSIQDYNPLDQIEMEYNHFRSKGDFDYYDWMTYIDLNHRLPELLLARLDRMTMAASIEGRVPFLDHEFASLCFSIPNEFKFKNNQEKYILKKAFEGFVPNEILYRPKQGFSLPLDKIFERSSDFCNNELITANSNNGILNQSIKISGEHSSHENYNLLNLSLWLNNQ